MSDIENTETFRYVTVMHQLKETETGDPGDRFVYHGERYDDVDLRTQSPRVRWSIPVWRLP